MTNRLRVGIVGAGYIADWHAKALGALGDTDLVAVCDSSEARARCFAERWNAPEWFADVSQMLAHTKLDAVHVLVPPGAHVDIARVILESGVSVLLEKPMGVSAESCAELVDCARARNLALGVSHNFLFAEPYERLRADVKSGRLGPIDTIDLVWHRELPVAFNGPYSTWFLSDPAAVLLEIGAHSVAALLDLVGEPESLEVHAARPLRLPTGVDFYRHWHVRASRQKTAINLSFSFVPAFDEQVIHVRGGFGTATANLSDNTYAVSLGTGLPMDFDRYSRTRSLATQMRRQANAGLAHYLRSKCGLSKKGNPFGYSILQSMRDYYRRLRAGETLDDAERIGGRFGQRVVAEARRMMDVAKSAGFGVVPRQPLPTPVIAAVKPQVLVIGGTGFIGRCLVRNLLQAGRGVRLLARNPQEAKAHEGLSGAEIVQGDARSLQSLEDAIAGIEVVYHLAKGDYKTLADYVANDVEPTQRLGELCVRRGVRRLIYAGTIDSLYLGPGAGVVDHTTPLDTHIGRRNNYARGKAMAESRLAQLSREQGLALTIVRPAIVLGPGSSPCHWGVGMWAGLGICRFWGDGDNPLPLVLVEDVAKAMAAAFDAPGVDGKVYNLSSAPMLSARQYVSEIERYTGFHIQTRAVPAWRWCAGDYAKWAVKVLVRHPDRSRIPSLRDWQCRQQWAAFDQTAARRDLGWNPCERIEELIEHGIHAPLDTLLR